MAKNGFFAYDIFSSGSFGLTVFSITTEVQVAIMSMACFGSVGFSPFFQKICGYKDGKETRGSHKTSSLSPWAIKALKILAVAFNLVMLLTVVFSFSKDNWEQGLVLISIFIFVANHILFLVMAETKLIWNSLKALCFILIGLSIIGRNEITNLLALGLKTYGVGGGLPVVVKQESEKIEGSLSLLSPDFVYMVVKTPDKEDIAIFSRGAVSGIYVSGSRPKN